MPGSSSSSHCTWIRVNYKYTYYVWYDHTLITGFVFPARSSLLTKICLTTYLWRSRWSNVVEIKVTWPQILVAMSSRGMLLLATPYGHVCSLQCEMSQQLQPAIDGSSWAMVISNAIRILTMGSCVGCDKSQPISCPLWASWTLKLHIQLRFVVIHVLYRVIPVPAVSRRRIGMDTKAKVISIAMMVRIRFQYPKGSQLLLVAVVGATLMLLLAICATCRPAKLVRPASNLHPGQQHCSSSVEY